MNEEAEAEEVKQIFIDASRIISKIQKCRNNSTVIVLFCFDHPIIHKVGYIMNKVLRKVGNVINLDLFIESSGGDIDAAAKIAKLCRSHCTKFSVLVPFYAKSAATLIAISADELVMTKAGELGPVDPQVRHPALDVWIPAHSIRDALTFIETTTDPFVKLTMADKLDPLLIGSFEDAQKASQQYVIEVFQCIEKEENRKRSIETFTTKYKSHGYPIDREICKEVCSSTKKEIIFPNNELEELLSDLHELYVDNFLLEKVEKSFIIQTENFLEATIHDEIISTQNLLKKEKEPKKEPTKEST